MAKRISTGSTAVFSFGGKITDILLRIGVKKDNILECPIGIDQRWLHGSEARQRSGKIVFAFVGRDERRKGVHELSVALVQMATTDPAFHFHFIGPIAEGNKLEAKNITYHGSVANEERIREVLREADVLLCPSYSEGMPTVIMEAMASGLAVIATDVGAISQQVGANGWLIPDPRPASIRAAMEEAIALPDAELVRMKQRSMDKVRERFIWGQVIERKLDLMRRFVAESTR